MQVKKCKDKSKQNDSERWSKMTPQERLDEAAKLREIYFRIHPNAPRRLQRVVKFIKKRNK